MTPTRGTISGTSRVEGISAGPASDHELQRTWLVSRPRHTQRLAGAGGAERRDDRALRTGDDRLPGATERQRRDLQEDSAAIRLRVWTGIRQRGATQLERHLLRPGAPASARHGRFLA